MNLCLILLSLVFSKRNVLQSKKNGKASDFRNIYSTFAGFRLFIPDKRRQKEAFSRIVREFKFRVSNISRAVFNEERHQSNYCVQSQVTQTMQ